MEFLLDGFYFFLVSQEARTNAQDRRWVERGTGLELNLRRDTQSLWQTEEKSKRYRKGRTELLEQNHRSEMDSIYRNKGWFNPPGTSTLFPLNSLYLQPVAWLWAEVLEHVFILVSMCQSLKSIVYNRGWETKICKLRMGFTF